MKKQLLSIVALTIGLLAGGTFAQDLEYSYCSQNNQGDFICQEYQSCNNPDGVCFCTQNSLRIPHNTTCFKNNTLVKNRVVTSFGVSGSIVTFTFKITNNISPKYFDVLLPSSYDNQRIKVLELSSGWLTNGRLIALNGFTSPKYYIGMWETRTIVITGEIVSSSFLFNPIETSACLRLPGLHNCIEQPVSYILPTTNYTISQRLLDPKPIFSGDNALYEIIVTNNWSREASNSLRLVSTLWKFLGTPSLSEGKSEALAPLPNGNTYTRDLGMFSAGATKTYLLKAPFTSTPAAGTPIVTTGTLQWGDELLLIDNIAVTSYTLPTVVDISLENLQKISAEPEANGEEIGYSLTYNNKWNTRAENLSLTAFISGTDQTTTVFSLPDLEPETMNTVVITWLVNQNYPIGTRFCFDGTIKITNETETGNNNALSGECYTFVQSADITIEAELKNELVNINQGTTLNYDIKIANKGGKTANNITVTLFPSANQTSQTAITLTGITLKWGEEKIISYSSLLNNYPINGTTISLSGEVSFTGIDLDLTNNTFALSENLPGLADVYIHHTMLPFSGFKIWDTVTYIVTYGNSGFASAWNPMINFTLPSSIETPQTEWNLGKSLSAGSSWTIVVTWTLRQFLAAGTEFSSQARISTPSAQTTTGNDISLITWTVATYDNISFTISAFNQTTPLLNNFSPLQAISGDVIRFTIDYVNNGNVPASANIIVRNAGALTFEAYNTDLGTIGVNQQGSVVLTWRIAHRNFMPLAPTIEISYNGIWISRTFPIEEPYVCGDGVLTRDEMCDTKLEVTNPDQDCEEIQNVCTLVTKRITNRACVKPINGPEICSEAVINLRGPSCGYVDVTREEDDEATVRCFGDATNTTTPMSINCGNGDIWTGTADDNGIFSRTCRYDSAREAERSIISCDVANDTDNSQCEASVLSCDIDLDSKVVILDADEEEWTVEVECSLDNDDTEAYLQIDCGNGDMSKSEQDDHINYTCTYDEDEFSRKKDITRDIECLVNDKVACEDEVILDEGIMGICGDGVRQGYEQCDLKGDALIGNYLDTTKEEKADKEDKGQRCVNCAIKDKAATQCLSVFNGNISIEKGEYLPFWWKVNTNSFTRTDTCSDPSDKGKIIKKSLNCEFEIQRPWESGKQKTLTIFDKECSFFGNYPWDSFKIFNNFRNYMKPNTWAYAVNTKDSKIFDFIGDNLGEYKLRLKNVDYEYCDNDNIKQASETDNVCETNFTITKPYLVQKSAFGIHPKATDIDLRNFYDLNKEPLVTKTDLAEVMVLDTNEYAGDNRVIDLMIDGFVSTAEKLAVPTSAPWDLKNKVTAKKVPNKDIYILEGNNNDIQVINGASILQPFTLIVKNANLVINGNIDVNGMFIVQNGTIKFTDTSCKGQQIVKGIFVANKFSAEKNSNTSLEQEWCNAGWLHVKGVLMGGDINNLVENKRSNLSQWFKVNWSESTQKIQRRNMIFNGASVLIEYSPELWEKLPPGADEFTKALEIYKK